ncbi:unnamed protein product [Strongylus vulgaris]|uniref:Uncharacterized protein n=1 Tax=Strongylus vulgaris TaxID=40348 RepID=A0A3P7JXJ5_STRVU|nr:unnamed protein product [Strongylus vulgaris]
MSLQEQNLHHQGRSSRDMGTGTKENCMHVIVSVMKGTLVDEVWLSDSEALSFLTVLINLIVDILLFKLITVML